MNTAFCKLCGCEKHRCACGPVQRITPAQVAQLETTSKALDILLAPATTKPKLGGPFYPADGPHPDLLRTSSGRYVNVLDPDPATLDIEDIAHALSHMPRYGGHLPEFYSVAQHCVIVATLTTEFARPIQYQGLMHDASEAYLMDVPKPLKNVLPEYQVIEDRMMHVLAKRFDFPWPITPEVKKADGQALRHEWGELMLRGPHTRMRVRTPEQARLEFLDLYAQLRP